MALRALLLTPALAAGSCLEMGTISKDPLVPLPSAYFKTWSECQRACETNPTCQWFSFKEDSAPTPGACYYFTKTDVATEPDAKAFSGPKGCQDTTVLTDAATAAAGMASNLQEGAAGTAADMQNTVNGQLNSIQEGANGAAATVADGLNGLQEGASGTAASMADTVNGHLNSLQEGASGAASSMADTVNGHVNSLKDGVAGAAASFKEGAAHAFDVTGTNQDHPVAEHMGMAANGLIPAGVFTSEDGGKGKALAAGSSADDHTALYAILGGGVGAALIGAGAFAMTGGKGTSPEKRKVKRGLSNAAAGSSQARQVDVEAAAASLQRAAPAMAPMAPQVAAPAMAAPCQYPTEPTAYAPMAYQAEGYQMYQPQAYQAYQPQGYQMAYQPAAYQQPMTYQAAPAYQPVTYQQ
ncbi:unnamed protein product [Effrenium voratum]|nr:unnamed protein product [Effrenium voratum]